MLAHIQVQHLIDECRDAVMSCFTGRIGQVNRSDWKYPQLLNFELREYLSLEFVKSSREPKREQARINQPKDIFQGNASRGTEYNHAVDVIVEVLVCENRLN